MHLGDIGDMKIMIYTILTNLGHRKCKNGPVKTCEIHSLMLLTSNHLVFFENLLQHSAGSAV